MGDSHHSEFVTRRVADEGLGDPDVAPVASHSSATSGWWAFGSFAVAAIAIRLVFLALDREPRFFLGDSGSYLGTAFGHWIPPDRSWVYGLLVNALLWVTHRLVALILVQSIATAMLIAGTATFLVRVLRVRGWVAWVALLLLSLEPMSLYYDRSIMTEAAGTVALCSGVLFAASTLCRRARWIGWCGAAALLAATGLRSAVVPVVLWVPTVTLGSGLLDWRAHAKLRLAGGATPPHGSVHRAATLLATVLVGVLGYAILTGSVTRSAPSLNPKGGYFLLGAVAPIVAPVDFAGLGLEDPEKLLEQTRHEDMEQRNCQLFCPDALCARLERALGDWRQASKIATVVARRSVLRDPLGFVRLCAKEAHDYLTPAAYRAAFESTFGLDRELSADFVTSLQSKVVDDDVTPTIPMRPSLALSWLRACVGWLPALCWLAVLLPALALARLPRMRPAARPIIVLLATSIWLYLAFVFAFSVLITPRYLLVITPLCVVLGAMWLDSLLPSRSAASEHPGQQPKQARGGLS